MVRRVLAVFVLSGAVLGVWATAASAHVHIVPDSAPSGGDATAVFTVPNEESSANTVELQIQFPTDHPIGTVTVAPVPGWTINVTKTKLSKPVHTDDGDITDVVSEVTWTGGTIAPNQFQEFPVSFDSLPDDVGSLTFPAVQTYSNGDVVRWIETDTGNGVEPEHPAPVLTLTKSATATATTTTKVASSTTSSDSTARALGIVAIIVAALALVAGVGALMRKPSAAARE